MLSSRSKRWLARQGGWSSTLPLLWVLLAACSDEPEITPTATPKSTPTVAPVTPSATATQVVTPSPTSTPADLDLDGDGFTDLDGDCNDDDDSVYPGAVEVPYDGIDQDCLNGDLTDVDQDGFDGGENGPDCNDANSSIYPGATELGDGQDNNCNGEIDEGVDSVDNDGDGFSELTGDCNDADTGIYPGAAEIPYDGIDQDCSGLDLTDVDGDGFPGGSSGSDCNDSDASIHPSAPEVPYDGIDQDCNLEDELDVDNDGSEGGPDGDDCDDADPGRSPELSEIPYDGIDQDCTGADLSDVDGDGYAGGEGGTDCNDSDDSIHPNASEVPYDGIDQDCSGTDLTDVDGDTYSGGSNGTDCNDNNSNTYPGAPEFEDDQDNDCDGSIDEDLDSTDDDGDGYSEQTGDCNDQDTTVKPDGVEVPYDGIDQDCSGADLTDVDKDGFSGGSSGNDCNDNAAEINPSITEVPYDGIDQDCSGADLTDVDGDGFNGGTGGTDCDDTAGLTNPNGIEVAYDGIDQDCSGADLTDVDGDGYDSSIVGGGDCNDSVKAINPSADEVCDSVDNNCDGVVDADAIDRVQVYTDGDGDSFGDPTKGALVCTMGAGQVRDNTDCNDSNASAYPGAAEVCDGVDNSCDGNIDEGVKESFYEDADEDSYGAADSSVMACSAPEGYVEDDTDCDDEVSTTYPGALESCNGVDDDCDDVLDEGVLTTYYQDNDGDSYGSSVSVEACAAPSGYVSRGGDCNDASAGSNPGAKEVCDSSNTDEDCDGKADDADSSVDANTKTTFYRDTDGDGYGSPTVTTKACDQPTGYVSNGLDCNAADASVNPAATEVVADNIDQNCDGKETCYKDADNDGQRPDSTSTVTSSDADCLDANEAVGTDATTDCDDNDAQTYLGATELTGDGKDQSCDGLETCYKDGDSDGFRPDTTSTVPSSDSDCSDAGEALSSAPTTDCNDSNAAIKPGATEIAGDSVDQNCDGQETCYLDGDDDGYRPDSTSTVSSTNTSCGDAKEALLTDPTGDCNDSNAAIKPGATELSGDSVDQNCDGQETCYLDGDDDGYRPDSTSTVSSPNASCGDAKEALLTDPTGDCNDSNAAIRPNATELPGDSVDQNCDGQETCYLDGDDDGYRPDSTSTVSSTNASCGDAKEALLTDPTGDCDDSNAAIRPNATELPGDSVDQNCDRVETCYKDTDNDGYRPDTTSTVGSTDTDCLDASEAVSTDPTTDCNDNDAAVKPGVSELPGDNVDQNCDGAETCYKDSDDDGYRPDSTSTVASTDADCSDAAEAIFTDPTGDCNDANASIKPGATETLNGVDDNCNGTTDEGVYATTCKDLKSKAPSSASGIYTIDPDGSGSIVAYQVYCDMTSDGGGWTLVIKANGNNTTFSYDAALWTNQSLLNTSAPGFDTTEAKLSSFNNVAFTEIRVVMRDGGTDRALKFSRTATSLYAAMTAGYFNSNLGRNTWKGLMANPSLQPNCNLEGLNSVCGGDTKIRIGIVSNQENDCGSCDSRIGIGGQGTYCGQNTNISVGNTATCSPDNGDRNVAAFGFVFVR